MYVAKEIYDKLRRGWGDDECALLLQTLQSSIKIPA